MKKLNCKLQIANCKLQIVIGVLAAFLGLSAPVSARTIVITDEDCDDMAVISEDTPDLSWAMYDSLPGVLTTYMVSFNPKRAVLIRYPLDKIPKGQRITSAEWIVPLTYVAGSPHLEVRRMLAKWGMGVCHKYAKTYPKKVKWSKPGGRGVSSDRALKATAKKKVTEAKTLVFNVTEDVELWYSGSAANNGWILTDEDEGICYFSSPISPWVPGKGQWKLRITYEPK
jgi:hypothetical protein